MENTEQIELELELDPVEIEKKDDDIVVEPAETSEIQTKRPELTVDDGISELKARLEEERKAREEAERRAREASLVANAAKNDAADSNLRMIDNAIETVKRNQEILKQNLRDAIAAGDADAQANYTFELQKSEYQLNTIVNGKQQYEASLKQQQISDPVEEIASRLTPRSADWVRAHPEYAKDPVLTRRMVRAHEDALDEGLQADTDDYFRFVETKLKIRKPEQEESPLSEAATTQKRSAPPAAPVSRSAPNNNGQKSNVIRLTAAEREHAAAFGMTDREYAIQKQALIREGKLAG
jgi:hypothetical protein